MYLRGLAGESADDVLDRLRQVATLLPHTDQEVMQLLIPAKHIPHVHFIKLIPHVFIFKLHTSTTSYCMYIRIFAGICRLLAQLINRSFWFFSGSSFSNLSL